MLISFSCKNTFEVIFDTQWMIIESLKTTITKMPMRQLNLIATS